MSDLTMNGRINLLARCLKKLIEVVQAEHDKGVSILERVEKMEQQLESITEWEDYD